MKKTIMILTLFCSITTVYAQKTKIGIRGGINLANFNTTGTQVDVRNKTGIDAALLAEFKLSERFSIQPEIGFGSFGTRFGEGDEKATYNLNYIIVPVLAKFNTTEGLSVFAGPAAAIMLSAKGKFGNGQPKQDLKEFLTTSDFLAVMGVEYNLPMGIMVGLRYQHGLTNIVREEEGSIKNKAVSISVGYKLGLGK